MTETQSMFTCRASYRQRVGKPHALWFALSLMPKYNTQTWLLQFTVVTLSALEIGAV